MKKLPSYEVGYGRPPKSTQWQKGQCGNPKRIRKKNPKPVVDMIDEFFAGEIDIVENGISRRVSHFEAIVLQLWLEAMAGTKRAAFAAASLFQSPMIRDRTQLPMVTSPSG